MDEKVKSALDFIKECAKKYKRIAVLSSWGKDSIVVLHLVIQVLPDIPVVFIDTTFKPKETYEIMNVLKEKWNLNLKIYRSPYLDNKEFMQNVIIGQELWKTNPDLCCQILKVKPTQMAVEDLNLEAWFSGLRATESEKRSIFKKIHRQDKFIRLHPLHDWTEADIWRYIACYDLPVHSLYKEGYRSIGCAQCSSSGGEHERDGRWKGTSKQGCGCGLHDTCMIQEKKKIRCEKC
jgi:phosphoadenosine phosphosulfate reductase